MIKIDAVNPELLSQQIDAEVARLEKNRDRDKRKAKYAAILTATGTAAATMMLGLSKFIEPLEVPLQAMSIIIGTVTTTIIAWDKLFDHKKLWVLSAQSARELYRLKECMAQAQATDCLTEEMALKFFDEYRNTLSVGDAKWDALRKNT